MKGELGRPREIEMKVKYPGFRDRLQESMRRYGITRAEMAKKIGATDATFGHYYNGERVPGNNELGVKRQRVLCETLNVSWDWLIHGTPTKGEDQIREVRVIQIPVEDLEDLRAFERFWERIKKYLPPKT